jgi:hypothetical protein
MHRAMPTITESADELKGLLKAETNVKQRTYYSNSVISQGVWLKSE